MVIVKDYFLREGEKGDFVTLQLEGEIELVQSQSSGRHYATARRCNIYSTFDEETASRMIGSVISGRIVRVPCEPFEYTIPETGEVITLNFSWDYNPDDAPAPKLKKKPIPMGIMVYEKNKAN